MENREIREIGEDRFLVSLIALTSLLENKELPDLPGLPVRKQQSP
jgi:hypothetical protein